MFVSVAIPIPSPKTFSYAVPQTFQPAVAVGKRVVVPFGKRRVTGWIVGIQDGPPAEPKVREISDLPDPDPLFDAGQLRFYEWISRYYVHPPGRSSASTLPSG